MIQYIEKCGLHDVIRRAGHWLHQHDNIWISSDDAAVQALIDGYTLEQTRAAKSAEISIYAKALRDKVIASISPGEMASWPIKLAEAAKFAASGNPEDAPMLSAEAQARGIGLADLVGKVGGNASGFAALEALIGGTDGRHRDAIKACSTFEEIAAYDFSSGWPEV